MTPHILRLLTVLLGLQHQAQARLERVTKPPGRSPDENGSVTIEHVLWAVAVIGIVAIVVAAVKAYVTSQAGNLK